MDYSVLIREYERRKVDAGPRWIDRQHSPQRRNYGNAKKSRPTPMQREAAAAKTAENEKKKAHCAEAARWVLAVEGRTAHVACNPPNNANWPLAKRSTVERRAEADGRDHRLPHRLQPKCHPPLGEREEHPREQQGATPKFDEHGDPIYEQDEGGAMVLDDDEKPGAKCLGRRVRWSRRMGQNTRAFGHHLDAQHTS
eukprot:SAG22_NODE_2188_length_2865_cov_5.442878_6_plen_197_part_00